MVKITQKFPVSQRSMGLFPNQIIEAMFFYEPDFLCAWFAPDNLVMPTSTESEQGAFDLIPINEDFM